MKIEQAKAWHFMEKGVIKGKAVEHYQKPFTGLAHLYQDVEAVRRLNETTAYTVYSYFEGDNNQQGNLNWGLTIIHPILIGTECNMTRGHFHEDRNCAEFYFGITGEGLLLMMDDEGETWAQEVRPGSLHHIDGKVAHRLVNTGAFDLKVGACWPTTAGHDYTAIEIQEFGYRIFKENGQIIYRKKGGC
ncbi:MAG: glucose-6-phosphate isomerase family protein [Culicoidibacterales bacterium]